MNTRLPANLGPAMNVAKLRLAPHVHACTTHDGMVFLDLRQGKYFGIGSMFASELAGLLELWSGVHQDVTCLERCSPAAMRSISLTLVERGLLEHRTGDLFAHRSAALPISPPLASIDQILSESPRLLARDIRRFISASVVATASLHCLSLETIAKNIRRRKAQRTSPSSPQSRVRMAELAATFRQIRSYAFSARNRCLLESLVLTEFLARYDEFPIWYIGVKTAPFSAHSWVQHLDLVLNGTPEQVSFFTPIVVI